MPKATTAFELTLDDRPQHQTLTSWLYAQLRLAILEGRLRPGGRLPASRDFATQYGLSRGTVVSVFERLQAEGYVSCRIGSGTRVNRVAPVSPVRSLNSKPPVYIRRVISHYVRPKPWINLAAREGVRPFCMGGPAIAESLLNSGGGLRPGEHARFGPGWTPKMMDVVIGSCARPSHCSWALRAACAAPRIRSLSFLACNKLSICSPAYC